MKKRVRLQDDLIYALLAETFKALGDETRARILHILSQRESSVGELTEHLSISQPAVSHHLRILRVMRLVKVRREGRSAFYALDDAHIERLLADGLEHVQEEIDGT